MKRNFAIFDVDHTLITRDSMFLFFWFSLKKKPQYVLNIIPVVWNTVLFKLGLIKVGEVKKHYFYLIKKLTEADLEEFYDNKLSSFICDQVRSELIKKKEEGYHILLVSASPYAYLKYFEIKMPQIDKVIATELKVDTEGKYINTMKGENCSGEEKVRRIHQYLDQNNLSINFEDSYAYSDSKTDKPMFQLVKHKKWINKRLRRIEDFKA